jgi:hypothetical protein
MYRAELTSSFLAKLDALELFLAEAEAASAYDDLITGLQSTVEGGSTQLDCCGFGASATPRQLQRRGARP